MQSFRTDDGVRIAYQDEGQGPPLLLLHGWTMTGDVWQHQIDHFRRTHRVLAPDLRGCGRSGSRPASYTMARYATDVDQLLVHLDLKDVMLVGWSMGGGITMEYLARFGPQRLRAVGLVDFPPQLEEDPSVADKVCASLKTRRDEFIEKFMRRMVLDPSRTDLVASLQAQSLQCASETACDMYRAMRPTTSPDDRPQTMPAFLAFPTNGWFYRSLADWKRRFPQHVAPDFPASRHCPFLEEPAAFNEALGRFLGSQTT